MKDMKLKKKKKESEKIKIKKSINEYEDLKSQSLLKLGIMTFDKIRKNEIHDKDFNEICEEIKNYDIEIYTKYMQLKNIENENNKTTCECGYVALKNEKFCPQCGKSLIKDEVSYIICPNCNQEIDEDSKFCSCCGNKIEEIIQINEDDIKNGKEKFENLQKNLLKNKKPNKLEKNTNDEVTKIYLNVGKKKKIRVVDIVGAFSNVKGLTNEDIGVIEVKDVCSYVDILNYKGENFLKNNKSIIIKKKEVKVKRDNS